jgi:hypothetical protein
MEEIADAAANEIGLVMMLVQPVENLQRVRVDLPARDRMFRARYQEGFHRRRLYQIVQFNRPRLAVLESLVSMRSGA